MEKWIWFDMDGTVADLYSVNGWLEDLRAFSTRPYENAKLMYNPFALLEVMAELKFKGYKLGVISWGSKVSNVDYDSKVALAKKRWLEKEMLSTLLDEVIVTPYGVCKADTCRKYGNGILVDDEEQNRNVWNLGSTINAKENILEALWKLAR